MAISCIKSLQSPKCHAMLDICWHTLTHTQNKHGHHNNLAHHPPVVRLIMNEIPEKQAAKPDQSISHIPPGYYSTKKPTHTADLCHGNTLGSIRRTAWFSHQVTQSFPARVWESHLVASKWVFKVAWPRNYYRRCPWWSTRITGYVRSIGRCK